MMNTTSKALFARFGSLVMLSFAAVAPAATLDPISGEDAIGVAVSGTPTDDRTFTCLANGSGCPARITDSDGVSDGTATAAIVVPPGACLDLGVVGPALEVAVGAKILHANIGDLRITLLTPFNVRYELLRRPATPGGGAGSCSGDDLDATFSDTLFGTPPCGASIPALSGGVTSFTGLFSLAGPVQNGEWMIEVKDLSHGGDGALQDWSLIFTCSISDTLFMDGFE